MSTTSENFLKSFDQLPDRERFEVAREILRRTYPLDDEQLATLYSEFTHADADLAEAGMVDYERGLAAEDNE